MVLKDPLTKSFQITRLANQDEKYFSPPKLVLKLSFLIFTKEGGGSSDWYCTAINMFCMYKLDK